MIARSLCGVALSVGAAGSALAEQPPSTLPPATPTATLTSSAATPPTVRLAKAVNAMNAPQVVSTVPAAMASTPYAITPVGGSSCPSYADCADPANACGVMGPCCTPCGPPGRFWIDAGYAFWTVSGQNLPPLVTSGPADAPRATGGALGQPGTNILNGGNRRNSDFRSGFYLNAGLWFNECQTFGIEGNFFYLGQSNQTARFDTNNAAVLTRPFFNTQTGLQDTQLVSFPNVLDGNVTVNNRSDLIGGGFNFIKNCCCSPCGRFDLLLGYQYFNLSDDVFIREDLTSLPGQTNVVPGTRFIVEDRFSTENNFHGGNIGFSAERRFSHWYVGLRAGVALGVNHQVIDINGSTTITVPGGLPQTFSGGLLTQPSNIGRYTRDEFAVLPWIGAKIGVQLTPRLRAYVGYDFMYLSNVVRAGDQIDLRVNPTQIPPRTLGTSGPLFPVFEPRTTNVTVQGIRIGVEMRF